MSNFTRHGAKIIVKIDDDDWNSGLGYELIDAIKHSIPKCDRKYDYKTKIWSIYAFPKNVAIIKPLYDIERQIKMVLDKGDLEEHRKWMMQFDNITKVPPKVVEVLL